MHEGAIVELETRLAEVMSLADLSHHVLDHLQLTLGATGLWLYSFGHNACGMALGGSLLEPMQSYTNEIYSCDPLQAYARSLPKESFLSNQHDDFDTESYLRSTAYWEFYRPNAIHHVQGIFPSGLAFGTRDMFGISVAMNDLQDYAGTMTPILRHVEAPFRAAARRIMRFRPIETGRDVLELIAACSGLCALWDESANLLWCSPDAARCLDAATLDALAAAVDLGLRQSMGRRTSLNDCILGRAVSLRGVGSQDCVAEFSCVRTPEHRVYVLGQIRIPSSEGPSVANLTRTERRVLALLARGYSNAEIARELFVSRDTVKTHVSRILHKLGVASRAKAVVAAQALGITDAACGTSERRS